MSNIRFAPGTVVGPPGDIWVHPLGTTWAQVFSTCRLRLLIWGSVQNHASWRHAYARQVAPFPQVLVCRALPGRISGPALSDFQPEPAGGGIACLRPKIWPAVLRMP